MAQFCNNLHICGNILSSESYSYFALQCTVCDSAFGQWSSFLKHLEMKHRKSKINDDVSNDYKDNFTGDVLKQESLFNYLDENDLEGTDHNIEPLSCTEEEHAVYLEAKDEVQTDNDDEPMIDIMPDEESDDKSDIRLQRQISVDCSSIVEYKPQSSSDEEDANGLKKFRFTMTDSKYKQMSLLFLKELQTHRLLWDPKNNLYRNPRKRSGAIVKIRQVLKKKKIDANEKLLQTTITNVLQKYKLARQEVLEMGDVCLDTEYFLKKCEFLNSIDGADKVVVEEAEISSNNDSEDDLPDTTSKFQNRIQFSEITPIVEDFIERYRQNSVLWDATIFNFNNRMDRRKILSEWSEFFKTKYNLQYTYDELSYSMQEFRRIYFKNVQRHENHIDLDDCGKFILEKGSFLPPRVVIKHLKCEYCDKIFQQDHTLMRHIYVDHGIGEMPFKCSFCDARFEDHIVHRRHEKRYHYKDYKYICEHCQKAFFTRDELDRHLVKHTGEKKFVCELCGRGFAKKTNMRNHDIRVHLRQRNYPCNMCPKAFYTKRLLQDHINAHLNIRDKICPTCGKGFTSHHSLIRHKQIHSEVKKYACKLCEARFHQFVGLNSHMKNTHKFVRNKNETVSDEEDKNVDVNV